MFQLFKRIARSSQASPRSRPEARNPLQAQPPRWSTSLLDPLPLPEGSEDEDAEWQQWETSRMGLDSQVQALAPSQETDRRGRPSVFDGLRALSPLRGKRPT